MRESPFSSPFALWSPSLKWLVRLGSGAVLRDKDLYLSGSLGHFGVALVIQDPSGHGTVRIPSPFVAKNPTGWTFGRGRSQCPSWGVSRARRDIPPRGELIGHEGICHLVGGEELIGHKGIYNLVGGVHAGM